MTLVKTLQSEHGYAHRTHKAMKNRRHVPKYERVKAFKRKKAELKINSLE